MSDATAVPELVARPVEPPADRDGRPETLARAPVERGTAIGRAYGAGSRMLARFVRLVLGCVVLVILAGILLALLKAHSGNGVVSEVHGWGRWLVGPFDGMFGFHRARVALAVNWGLAAVVYLCAGALILRLVGRSGRRRSLGASRPIPKQEAS